MQIFKSRRGSATVEAALILPLIFIIIFGIISIALNYYSRIYEQSQTTMESSYPEDVMRARSFLNNLYSSDSGDPDAGHNGNN